MARMLILQRALEKELENSMVLRNGYFGTAVRYAESIPCVAIDSGDILSFILNDEDRMPATYKVYMATANATNIPPSTTSCTWHINCYSNTANIHLIAVAAGTMETWTNRYILDVGWSGWTKTLDTNGYATVNTTEKWKFLPLGFEYIQRSGRPEPATLFGGGTWSNVSSEYAGLFERIEGGNAATYGSQQTDAMRDIQGYFSNAGFKPATSWNVYSGCFSSTTYVSGTTERASELGGYTVPRVTFKASSYLAAENIATEFRPVNSTVRLWRLTSY